MTTINEIPQRNFLARHVVANGHQIDEAATAQLREEARHTREVALMQRLFELPKMVCPKTGYPLRLKCDKKAKKEIKNPAASIEVPFGMPQPPEFIYVPNPNLGRYYYMTETPEGSEKLPFKDITWSPWVDQVGMVWGPMTVTDSTMDAPTDQASGVFFLSSEAIM